MGRCPSATAVRPRRARHRARPAPTAASRVPSADAATFAIGAPFGFENSVTQGIVSAKGRVLPDGSYVPFLQTDVAINPGNSGGPLVDLHGRLVGINSAIVGKGDYSESLVGNEHSLLCDPALSPIQDEGLEIVLTPEPSPPEPSCPVIAIDYGSMQWYCYTPNASGVIPVPPAPK